MLNFDTEKNGYNKKQVTKYFELVQKEYEELYSEYQKLRAQLQKARRPAESKTVYSVPPDRMEAIALALIDAEVEAQRIVNSARDKAWQIITDAKKGLPIAEASEKLSLPMNSVKLEETAVPQPQQPDTASKAKSTADDLDELIASKDDIDKWLKSVLSKNQRGGDGYGKKSR